MPKFWQKTKEYIVLLKLTTLIRILLRISVSINCWIQGLYSRFINWCINLSANIEAFERNTLEKRNSPENHPEITIAIFFRSIPNIFFAGFFFVFYYIGVSIRRVKEFLKRK